MSECVGGCGRWVKVDCRCWASEWLWGCLYGALGLFVYAWLSVVKFGESVVGERNVGVFGEV